MKALVVCLVALSLTGCVKTGYPGLMCAYKGNWSAIDDYALVTGKDAAGYRPTNDKLGNLYVVGYGMDATDQEHWLVRKSTDRGDSWTTVEDFQLITGKGAIGLGLLAQPSGGLLAVGYALGSSTFEWVVRMSRDAGATWTTPDNYQLASGFTSSANAITQDSAGNAFTMGTASDADGNYHWIVRKTQDGGTTWTTADDFTAAAGKSASAEGAVVDGAGTIFVSGSATNAADITRWTIRKSSNAGATWTTSDDYVKDATHPAIASSVAVDYDGTLVAIGYAQTDAAVPVWTVRKSVDQGANWTTVDEYRLASGQEAQANSAVIDPFGNFYVVGSAVDASAHRHLILRKSSDRGTTWTTLHDYQIAPDADTSGYRLSSDPDGNLYIVGRGQTAPASAYRWFTHRLRCE